MAVSEFEVRSWPVKGGFLRFAKGRNNLQILTGNFMIVRFLLDGRLLG